MKLEVRSHEVRSKKLEVLKLEVRRDEVTSPFRSSIHTCPGFFIDIRVIWDQPALRNIQLETGGYVYQQQQESSSGTNWWIHLHWKKILIMSQLMMALFVLRKLILQTRMRSHPMGARCLVFGRTLRLLPYFMCAKSEGSGDSTRLILSEPSLVAYVISTIISWAGSCDETYYALEKNPKWFMCRTFIFYYFLF